MKIVADQLVEQTLSEQHEMPNRMIVRNLGSAALYYALAEHILESGRDSLEIGLGFGATPAPEMEQIFNIAETMRRAAEANMAFFEHTTVEELAAYTGRHPDMIRQFFGEQEAGYRLATAASLGIQALNPELGEGPEAAMLILGYSQSSYGLSSGLIAKYYSLGTQFDDEFNTVSFEREEALEDMLDLADQRVKALLNQLGEDAPIGAIMSYQQARHFRDGTADQQLQALSYYWRATMMAQVGSYMVQR
jgi:hypothetical protein